jgi:hypothetical protein
MNRRQFITAAIGAAVVTPALPEYTTFLLPEEAIVYGLSPIEAAWEQVNLLVEYQEFMIRQIACAFDMSPYVLEKNGEKA